MTDVEVLLAKAKEILLVDWPSREVPESLAGAGYRVFAQEGPDEYTAYEVEGDEVRRRPWERPPRHADLVYAFRPLEELSEIVDLALSVGATAVWVQSGRNEAGERDPRACWLPPDELERGRSIVERAGLVFIASPYIADAARAL